MYVVVEIILLIYVRVHRAVFQWLSSLFIFIFLLDINTIIFAFCILFCF